MGTRMGIEPVVGGRVGFLFLDKNSKSTVAQHWEKYNSIYRVPMHKITPHVCRHTFCSNMAKSGMNPKTLQYIMVHSDISVTIPVPNSNTIPVAVHTDYNYQNP